MHIDRSLFFYLVAAGCDGGAASRVATIPVQPPAASPPASPASHAPTPEAPPRTAALPTPDGEAPVVLRPTCGWVDPQTAPHRTPPDCSDGDPRSAAPPSCQRLPKCDSFNPKKVPPFAEAACAKQTSYFKRRVAEEASHCLLRLSSLEICEPCDVHACLDRALKHACLDPTADPTCVEVHQRCPSVAMDECRDYLSGMKEEGRRKMLSCISSQSGCGFGLHACAEGLGL